ncbi:hypothetical protein AAMO2058_001556800 [Amorphochlora amoebiformis]
MGQFRRDSVSCIRRRRRLVVGLFSAIFALFCLNYIELTSLRCSKVLSGHELKFRGGWVRGKPKGGEIRSCISCRSQGSSFGKAFRITTFGESHGGSVGVIIDGCPSNLPLTLEDIQTELDRRKPGQSRIVSPRREEDKAIIHSGVEGNRTLGTPIMVSVVNKDARPQDYANFTQKLRPSHADASYLAKYSILAKSGGGRSSARETIGRVAAGAVAKKILKIACGGQVIGYVKSVGNVKAMGINPMEVTIDQIESNPVRCPDPNAATLMINTIEQTKRAGDSVGGIIECIATGIPAGLGAPVFDKLEADLAKAIMSIPATKAFEIGSGFAAAEMVGSEHNDIFYIDTSGQENRNKGIIVNTTATIRTITNHAGGVLGGVSNGDSIVIRAALKPTSTIRKPQQTVTVSAQPTTIEPKVI